MSLLIATLLGAAAIPALEKPDSGYVAGWVAVAGAGQPDLLIAEKQWESIIRFRPAARFVLDGAAVEPGRDKPLLNAGTAMIGIANHPGVACELERPRGDYFVGCVADKDGDGRSETFFNLNHANPFLFSALRQPRAKDRAIAPVTLTPQAAGDAAVEMVLFYASRAEVTGRNTFQLCVLRPDNRNIWGDKTVARGCLPSVTMGDNDFPRGLALYGRNIMFKSRDGAGVRISVSGADADVPVRL